MKASNLWQEVLKAPNKNQHLLKDIEKFAKENTEPALIHFGTSGWRGEIGSDFTMQNVRVITKAIIEAVKGEDRQILNSFGIKSFNEFKERGVIVGHDNRLLGKEFAYEVIGILQSEGINCYYAGEASTPEFSVAVVELSASASINLTPSHNPPNYGGLKLNPSDGGPASEELTKPIERIANELMKNANSIKSCPPVAINKIDATELYINFIKKRNMIDIDKIKNFLSNNPHTIAVDHMHGATRGKLAKILSVSPGTFICLRREDDPLFEGLSPEPSEENLKLALSHLRENTLGFSAIIDPDGDRVRFADLKRQIPMNYFGAMAFHYLYNYKGLRGVVVKSVGTSNFVNSIAEAFRVEVIETKVGFKNFRPYLLPNATKKAIVAFEESDGISIQNHTLEKDAILGVLLALEMIATFNKNLSDYLEEIEKSYGKYYSDRTGIEIPRESFGPHVKENIMALSKHFKIGDSFKIGDLEKKIASIVDLDGVKIIFNDGSWIMIRPSGTEPKVRIYIETKNKEEKEVFIEEARILTKKICLEGIGGLT
ncbi:phosphomannomutase [Thermodesulfovibrio yellowstonii]|uniref:Phosphoglucomutase/phosphomannomutase family protein n=1 Tax=Thermodesulfovibrio yellowstonii (strain ATCC 51303 / DSM 11347 / YP87) TaxID=289376 RepID=B5YH53_THEYD|nr:phosphomannomutase [Thermodesulfovibrio yellowstonii]ACI20440.1 phosphoglucomutase/phosphomannomutase family protein [Thermodesulfovibrio yellowstonii DSM 11347]MDI6865039.1 phosphomannomutase [Thermodesulfovibrio yellowstonii]